MQFHYDGYVSGDPRIKPPAGVGFHGSDELPGNVDVLIVGAGPAGMITAAQLSQFPGVVTRIVDRRTGRLEVGQADGIQPRSVETFDAFGFAERIVQEGCPIIETAFWKPDAADPRRIARVSRVLEDPNGVSEYLHITVNQARVLDYFAEFMANAPARMQVDWGWEFQGLDPAPDDASPVRVRLARTTRADQGRQHTVTARYVVGTDGAHSRVRDAIGCRPMGGSSHHAWGVMDLLAVTDFPDVRAKCAIQSESHGSILLIPREGGHLFRLYVDLGDVAEGNRSVRSTTVEETIARARRILHPYTLDVREVAWYSVYEVGHRVCDRFDDVPLEQVGQRQPRVFIAGDASHTHSAKAGQGMNVSMQDGWNIGWKLGHVLDGRSPPRLLATYSAERQIIGQDIIAFDKRWAETMARPAEQFSGPRELEQGYLQITEFAQGFMTQYGPSMITGRATHQALARGYPVGKRFRSALVTRVADAFTLHLGHEHKADGRWRIYVFSDVFAAGESVELAAFSNALDSCLKSMQETARANGQVLRPNDWFDVKIIYQQPPAKVDLSRVPPVFLPQVGKHALLDRDNVFSPAPQEDIFSLREVDRGGVVVVVRPDQYVSQVLPLNAVDELLTFLRGLSCVSPA